MVSTTSSINIEKLNSSSNFNSWQQRVYELFIQQDLLSTLDGPKANSFMKPDWIFLYRDYIFDEDRRSVL